MSIDKRGESLILSVETATRGGSLAVLRGADVLAKWEGAETFSHSSELLIVVKQVLDSAAIKLNDVDVFAVVLGPGSFTGLRVGIATVKGLCAALQKPAVGVPTLEALSFGLEINQTICAVLPAGRGEVFAQISNGADSRLLTIKLSELLFEIKKHSNTNVIAPLSIQNQIKELMSKSDIWTFIDLPENIAVNVGRRAWQIWQSGERNQDLTIIYGRGADAAKPNKAV